MARRRARYSRQHDIARARFLKEWGNRPCVRCGEPIEPGQPVDLDHRDDGQGYLGLSHSSCNRTAGARKLHGILEQRRAADPRPEGQTKW